MTDNDTLVRIMAADQESAATSDLARTIAAFYEAVAASGMHKRDAGEIAKHFASLAVSQHFGIDVSDPYGIGAVLDMED